MLREGSIRRDLEATLPSIISRGLSTQRVILVTDSMAPDDVAAMGHMDFVVRRAISLGMPPAQAIQAITLNAATYCGLEQEIGGIAPGRCADFTLLEDLQEARVHSTLIGGALVAERGESLARSQPITFPADTTLSLRLDRNITSACFRIPCPSPSAKIRVMELINSNITVEKILPVGSNNGHIEADLNQDLLKVAVFERHGERGKMALGFVKGFGAQVGAVGTTICLDENTLLVAGSSDEDMALCANALVESGGGIAVVERGEVLEKMEMPVGGIFSLSPWRETGQRLSRINGRLRDKGSPFPKPLYALMFLTFVTLPALRITARGLVAAKERRLVSLFAEG
jgi:adenine deaminase